jgi:hypothetical protein
MEEESLSALERCITYSSPFHLKNIIKNCVHMYVNAKMIPVEIMSGIGVRGIKESSGGSEFNYDMFDTL